MKTTITVNENERTHLLISVMDQMAHRLRLIGEEMPEQHKWDEDNFQAASELYKIYKKLGGKGDYTRDFQIAKEFIDNNL